MSFTQALRFVDSDERKTGFGTVLIDIEVTPGAKNPKVPSGYNPWRKRIEVRLSEQAQKGKANDQLIEEIASFFDVPKSAVTIESGASGTKKTVRIECVMMELIRKKIEYALTEKIETDQFK